MRRKKLLIAAGAVLASLAVVIAPSAAADPVGAPIPRPLSGGGSDTTQDVMNALAAVVQIGGQLQLGSYDAPITASPNPYTTKPGCSIPRSRTNGSSAGVSALQDALEGVADVTGTGGVPCFDFARSSSNSASSNPSNPPGGPGRLSYIPFAVDGLTVVTRDDSALPNEYFISTNPADATNPLNLVAIFRCNIGDPTGAEIRPVLPQIGSGTRQFFLDSLGVARADQPSFEAVNTCINLSFPGRVGPQEHRGNQISDPRDIAPYSTAVYLSQINRVVNDAHGRAVLGRINPIRSAVPNPAAGAVGIAIRSDSGLPNAFSVAELGDFYNCAFSTDEIRPVLPAPGAVRTAFLNRLGVPAAQHAAYHVSRPCINVDFPASGRVGPAENVGSVIADSRSVVPYDINAYTAQINREVFDAHGRLIFGQIDNVVAQILNTGATLRRDVYNVIPASRETTTPWSTVFVGPGSLICQNTATINRLGFGTAGNCGALGIRTT